MFGIVPNPELSDLIGGRVRDARRREGLSVDQLAQRCADVGLPQLSPTALYLIEGGGRGKSGTRPRRRITVEELLGVAYALGVSPLTLLLPEENSSYPVTPDALASARAVYEWFVGERLAPLPAPDAADEWNDEDRATAWFIFTRALRYVPEPSTHWLVNAHLEDFRQRNTERDQAIQAQLAALTEKLNQLTTKGADGGQPDN